MEIISLKEVSFKWEDLIPSTRQRVGKRGVSSDVSVIAERAYKEGTELIAPRAVFELYQKKSVNHEDKTISISLPGSDREETLFIGSRVDYLMPAEEVIIALCTVGKPIVDAMTHYTDEGDQLMAYYLDVVGVRALGELSGHLRSHIEKTASEKGWGVGPSMQPGSVAGWDVSGQSDLFRLGHGDEIGLTINNAHFLIPHLSDSMLIGMGENYSNEKVGSLCHECPRHDTCLWRRENVGEHVI